MLNLYNRILDKTTNEYYDYSINQMITLDKDFTINDILKDAFGDKKRWEIFPWIGLKDSKGKLIYQGDKVRFCENPDYSTDWYEGTIVWGGKYDYPAFDINTSFDFDGMNGISYIFGAGWHLEVV